MNWLQWLLKASQKEIRCLKKGRSKMDCEQTVLNSSDRLEWLSYVQTSQMKSVHSFPFCCYPLIGYGIKGLMKTSKTSSGMFLLISVDFISELQKAERLNSSITSIIPSRISRIFDAKPLYPSSIQLKWHWSVPHLFVADVF